MELFEFMKEITVQAGSNIRQKLNEPLLIETKSNANDLVTNMDKETERFLYETIINTYPEHKIIGEEGSGKDINDLSGTVWIIDPIDGTLNFVHQGENFAISVGVFIDGKKYAGVIYDVMRDKLYSACAGHGAYLNDSPIEPLTNTALKQSIVSINPNWLTKPYTAPIYGPIVVDARSARSYGSAALDFAYVATGKVDAYITLRLHPWDFAGGLIIAEEVGAVVTNQLDESLNMLHANSILVANKALHHEIYSNYMKPYQTELLTIHQGRFHSR
ncbi:inositol monophosphatase family protein [Macrococcus armenti]|uniref:inositol-phosphate phosphatase n=1 Tax=Macrococcus armenti TaxID=2875764 RepID=A0ABY3ZWV8_9STAP|nr:inositol monophosphatase family protein [Macrococcus armenti]UOB21282.1 inositol monophosphatase family protein [Macrococcus armenti]